MRIKKQHMEEQYVNTKNNVVLLMEDHEYITFLH